MRPELLRAALEAIFKRNRDSAMKLQARSPAGIPTAAVLRAARGKSAEFKVDGAYALERLFPERVSIETPDTTALRRYRLSLGEPLSKAERAAADPSAIDARKRYLDEVTAPARLFEAEGYVLFPKLKSAVRTHGVSGAIALQGRDLLDEGWPEGGVHHARRLVDHLEVAEPDLIISDGIEIAVGGSELTERAYPLGVIVMATNAVAHDATVSRILGIPPQQVEHLKLANDRGYGPLWANEVEVVGDLGVGAASAHAKGSGGHGYIPAVEFPKRFEREMRLKVPVEVIASPPYDVAGAPGVALEWLYMSYDLPKDLRKGMAQWPALSILAGRFEGKPPEPQHDRVAVLGDAAIAAWRRLGWSAAAEVRPPHTRERFKRPDGRAGEAILFPGEPPPLGNVVLGMTALTGGKAKAPLHDLYAGSFLDRLKRRLGMTPKPPEATETVSASAIERLKERKAERAAPPPEPEPAPDAPPARPTALPPSATAEPEPAPAPETEGTAEPTAGPEPVAPPPEARPQEADSPATS